MRSRVLIVDDSLPMREFLKMSLGDAVVVVGECSDGADALAAYSQLRPDWVLMDVDMKGMDGITATRQIIAAYPNAQVMMVTHHTDVKLRQAARDAGAAKYVLKEDVIFIADILKD